MEAMFECLRAAGRAHPADLKRYKCLNLHFAQMLLLTLSSYFKKAELFYFLFKLISSTLNCLLVLASIVYIKFSFMNELINY